MPNKNPARVMLQWREHLKGRAEVRPKCWHSQIAFSDNTRCVSCSQLLLPSQPWQRVVKHPYFYTLSHTLGSTTFSFFENKSLNNTLIFHTHTIPPRWNDIFMKSRLLLLLLLFKLRFLLTSFLLSWLDGHQLTWPIALLNLGQTLS